MLYVLNLGEDDALRLHEIEKEFRSHHLAAHPGTEVTAICGRIEAELAEIDEAEAREFMASYGLPESGLRRMITASHSLLGQMTFLTAGETEVRAWNIPVGSTALRAAGTIHTDFEKKFIRAEVVNWEVLVEHKGYAGAREKGVLRLEGRDYIVQDGDVLVIRHG
jgi:ribosome-binding ATPase YchF (GTP1/OBG family)